MAPDPVLDKLEAAFSKRRAEFVGCFDDEHQACSAGFRSTIGRRFLIKEVLEKDRVISIPWAVLADHR